MNKDEMAVQKMVEGYNCAQSVLFACGDDLGIDVQALVKVASGFGAGMGRKGEVCGALTGGIIALGDRYGRGQGDDRSATEATYSKTVELMDRFEAAHGTILCRELLGGCDLSTAEGRQVFAEKELGRNVCQHCVRTVVLSLEELL